MMSSHQDVQSVSQSEDILDCRAQQTTNGHGAGLEAFVSISSSPRPGPQDVFMALKSLHGLSVLITPFFESPLKDPREEHGGLRYSRRCAFPWMEWCLWIHGIRLNISSFCKALTTPDVFQVELEAGEALYIPWHPWSFLQR